ncbi:MAG: cytochrome b/b6 domain-containing protein, partial [Proteobacteria bacterium]|nr:cytochrome b/b6 domain-containing protein [Pseudomonadota bacterium]
MNRILVWDLPTRDLPLDVFPGRRRGARHCAHRRRRQHPLPDPHAARARGRLPGGAQAVLGGRRFAVRALQFLSLRPQALLDYLLGVGRDTAARHIGHNPGSTYALFAMLVAALGLAVTGPLVASQEGLEELHEIMAYALLAAVGAHLAGIVIHTIRHRENISLGMLDGKKAGEPAQAIRSSHVVVGLVLVVLVAGWAAMVVGGHDGNERRLTCSARQSALVLRNVRAGTVVRANTAAKDTASV